MKIRTFLVLLPLGLCGCQAIGDWFDRVGEHMPVIGDRCEHWQCFTEAGQEASDAKKAQEQQATSNAASANPTSNRIPANAPQTLTPPPTQPATPAGSGVAMPEYETPPAGAVE